MLRIDSGEVVGDDHVVNDATVYEYRPSREMRTDSCQWRPFRVREIYERSDAANSAVQVKRYGSIRVWVQSSIKILRKRACAPATRK